VLWPQTAPPKSLGGLAADTERGEVRAIAAFRCSGNQTDTCRRARITLLSGPEAGRDTTIELGVGGLDPPLEVGDDLRVARSAPLPEMPEITYTLADFERRAPMLWLAIAFAALVIIFARLRGLLSLVGLVTSLAVVLVFIVPAILVGEAPLAVALVGAMAVMLVTIILTHGLGPKGLSAVLGTAVSLGLTVALAVAAVQLTNLTGFGSEEATVLAANDTGVPLQGLLLAGMVVAALGVLDDVTVSQASLVLALRAANPSQAFGELVRRALEVGRDHVSATVNTLVLAYAGASLPSLLIFTSADVGFGEALNSELVAQEVVATLVGSIGLISAVPITTALAAILSGRIPVDELPVEVHGHGH
jgi:uncharacterized membrane protein